MSAGQQTTQGSIDEKLFEPLGRFFVDDMFDTEELASVFLSVYSPRPSDYTLFETSISPETFEGSRLGFLKGMLLEVYCKWVLSRFSSASNGLFIRSKIDSHGANPRYKLRRNRLGNIDITTRDDHNYSKILTEIDALYEFDDGDSTIPVVFEVNFGLLFHDTEKKRRLAEDIYGTECAYSCDIELTDGTEKTGLYKTGDHSMRIVISDRERFSRMAKEMYIKIAKSQVKLGHLVDYGRIRDGDVVYGSAPRCGKILWPETRV